MRGASDLLVAVHRETARTVSSLLAEGPAIRRYADIGAYIPQSGSRLEVVATDDERRITEAIGRDEFV